jgi:hypothetical protein
MNDRIDELAKECYVITGSVHTDHFAYWKFAELIIQECMDIANKNRSAMEIDRQTNLTANAIKKHFGVEE